MTRDSIWQEIIAERARQDKKHGDNTLSRATNKHFAITVITEEIGEVARAVLDGESDSHLADELIQVAACCVAWLEALP